MLRDFPFRFCAQSLSLPFFLEIEGELPFPLPLTLYPALAGLMDVYMGCLFGISRCEMQCKAKNAPIGAAASTAEWRQPPSFSGQSRDSSSLKRTIGKPSGSGTHVPMNPSSANLGGVLLDPVQTSRQLQSDDLAKASFMKHLQLALKISRAVVEDAELAEAKRQSLEMSTMEAAQIERWRALVTSRCAELQCSPLHIARDGNCQFNAVLVSAGLADQLTHQELRENVCQYISNMGSSVTDFMPGLVDGRATKSFKSIVGCLSIASYTAFRKAFVEMNARSQVTFW